MSQLVCCGFEALQTHDAELYALLQEEYRRQTETLMFVAATSVEAPSTLACQATPLSNVTTEGYPGHRFHAGCEFADRIEEMAIERARAAFGALYANVQPHSATSANEILTLKLLKPGDTLLGLDLDCGGHLTHGADPSLSGRLFHPIRYGLDSKGFIDYDQVLDLARRHQPKLIICGASSYPRKIDFRTFRQIADSVGAYLLADISHIAGLVAADQHQSPVQHAHFTTLSTYKQLCGPRGGLILMGADACAPAADGAGTLADTVQRAVFPFFQGTPHLSSIAAKAHIFSTLMTADWTVLAKRIVDDAKALAAGLSHRGYCVLTGGTDNHLVLVDLGNADITGAVAERALEHCGVIVNRNRIPGEKKSARIASGIRLGTNVVATRGMGPIEMDDCSSLVHSILSALKTRGDVDYELPVPNVTLAREHVRYLCRRFPLPEYLPQAMTETSSTSL